MIEAEKLEIEIAAAVADINASHLDYSELSNGQVLEDRADGIYLCDVIDGYAFPLRRVAAGWSANYASTAARVQAYVDAAVERLPGADVGATIEVEVRDNCVYLVLTDEWDCVRTTRRAEGLTLDDINADWDEFVGVRVPVWGVPAAKLDLTKVTKVDLSKRPQSGPFNSRTINIAKCGTVAAVGEWSGSPCPKDPDNFWIDDDTGERVCAKTGVRSTVAAGEMVYPESGPSAPSSHVEMSGAAYLAQLKAMPDMRAAALAAPFSVLVDGNVEYLGPIQADACACYTKHVAAKVRADILAGQRPANVALYAAGKLTLQHVAVPV